MIVVDANGNQIQAALQLIEAMAENRCVEEEAGMQSAKLALSRLTGVSAKNDDLIEEVELPGKYRRGWATREEYEAVRPRMELMAEHVPRSSRVPAKHHDLSRPDTIPEKMRLQEKTATHLRRARK